LAQQRLERQLRAGVAAAQQGQFDRARELLEGVLRQDRNNQLGYNELAWIWMAASVQAQNQRRKCLQEVLKINPANRPARDAINNLVGVIGSPATIDFNAIAAAAKAKMPAGGGETGRGAATVGAAGGGGLNQRALLAGIALVLGLLLVASFVVPPLLAPDPTPIPLPTDTPTLEVDESGATFTPRPPTRTPDIPQLSGQVVTRAPETAEPTNTPQPTPTPFDTATPTATLPPLSNMTLYIVAETNGEDGVLYRASGDGTGLQRVVDDIQVADVQDNRLVYTRVTAGEGEGAASVAQAYVTTLNNPDAGGQATRLTQGTIEALSISPDGSQMVFASTEDGDSELFLVNLQTGVVQKLTENVNTDTDPSWSPDGTRIIFTSDRNSLGVNKVFVHDLTNSEQALLVDANNVTSPTFSPDGSLIVYSSGRSDDLTITVSSADGTRSREIQFRDSNNVTAPTWSNDGRYVIFVASYGNRPDEIIFAAPDTGQIQRIVFPELTGIRSVIVE
jgi:dipeptidyl aminopeptidase/acylaminoacyl peptidase